MSKTGIYMILFPVISLITKGTCEEYSLLYGNDGALWQQPSRIADFSHAGYRGGDLPIPDVAISKNVKEDFGAKGDGQTDDTQAFLNAIAAINATDHGGALFVPEGTYVITQFLKIDESNLVIRGAGKEKTVLHFPKSCMEIEPRTVQSPRGLINWYHARGGVIWIEGSFAQTSLSNIITNAKRGDQSLTLDSTSTLKVGQLVEITQKDVEGTLTNCLYQGNPGDKCQHSAESWQMVKVESIKDSQIQIDRPLNFDVEMRWSPTINSFNPTVTEVGIENLTISMGRDVYDGHFFEEWNAIYFLNVADGWVRNVDVKNADEAFLIFGRFCTLDNVSYSVSTKSKVSSLGHNGVFFCGPGSDNLCQNFNAGAVFMHSLSVKNSYGNVFSKGIGNGIDFDMASQSPHSNLFTEIHVGDPKRIWEGSGAPIDGKSAAAFNTFWNISASSTIAETPDKWSLFQNVIGVTTNSAPKLDPLGKWFEPISPEKISPANLFEHQRNKNPR